MYNKGLRGPLIEGDKTYSQISADIIRPTETRPGNWWFIGMALGSLASL
ncbi:MAG: hypothetical protein ACOCZL_00445 [Bacteroidota bacterium]